MHCQHCDLCQRCTMPAVASVVMSDGSLSAWLFSDHGVNASFPPLACFSKSSGLTDLTFTYFCRSTASIVNWMLLHRTAQNNHTPLQDFKIFFSKFDRGHLNQF